jgi:Ca2+/Na+ antiporter
MPMPTISVIVGSLLVALGPVFFVQGGDHRSPTAFIPSFFGLIILACGLIAKNPAKRKGAMHGAAGVALLGLLGSLRGLSAWPLVLAGRTEGLTHSKILASWSTLLMFVLCLVYLALCIKSFREARKAREAG